MIITYLIIAHLLADFVFQPKKLIEWKTKSDLGVLVHVLIFVLLAFVILFPFLGNIYVWGAILLIGVIHFFTDKAKVNIELTYDTYSLPFVADQAIHFLSLLLGGVLLQNVDTSLPDTWFYLNVYLNSSLILFVLGAIYFIYLMNLLIFQKRKSKMRTVAEKLILFTIVYFVYFYTAIVLSS